MTFMDTAAPNGISQTSDSQAHNTIEQHMQIVTAHWGKFPVTAFPNIFAEVLALKSQEFFGVSPAQILLSLRIVSKTTHQAITSDPNHYKKYKITLTQDAIAYFNTFNAIPCQSFKIKPGNCSTKTFTWLIEKNADINELVLYDCKNISTALMTLTNDQLRAIFSSIEKLNLSSSDIMKQALAKILPYLTNLKEIDLSWCSDISPAFDELYDDQLRATFRSCDKLILIRSYISGTSIARIKRLCPDLEITGDSMLIF